MTKEEWIKKFKKFTVDKYCSWFKLDDSFLELVQLAKDCEKELGLDLFSGSDYEHLYRCDNHEIENLIQSMLDNGADWREIADLLYGAGESRRIFVLSDEGCLVSIAFPDLKALAEHILKVLKETK